VKRLLLKLLLLAVPALACGLFVLYVDPFNYVNLFRTIPAAVKRESVYGINSVLWNAVQYARAPGPNIVLGDSRAERIPLEYLRQATGHDFKRLTASAGKINEMADFFWFAAARTKLEKVYVVLNFNMYNQYAYADRVKGAEAAINNPLLYIFDRHVITASCSVLSAAWFNTRNELPDYLKDKGRFWAWALENWPPQQFGRWNYPESGHSQLREISDFCRDNRVELVFIITPNHRDYQKKIAEFHLDQEQERFKSDIALLGVTYDFDLPNEWTANRENFSDPIHITENAARLMMGEILSGDLRHGRRLAPGQPPGHTFAPHSSR